MKKIIAGIVVIVIIIFGISYFTKNYDKEANKEPIKIGATLPLTGEAASYGDGAKAGIDLAVKEINDGGGINGRKIEILFEDDKCSKDGATTISKLVNINKVVAIIGPLCSPAAGSGLPIAQNAKVPVIFWASAPNLNKIGDYLFRTYPSDALQGKFVAGYLFNHLKKQKIAIVYVKNDWGQGLRDVFVSEFKNFGGEIVFDEGVAQDTKDFKTVFTKLKQTFPDLVYLPIFPAGGAIAIKQMKDLGISVPVFGGDSFETEEFLKVPQAEGVMYSTGKFNNPEEFKTRVKIVIGKDSNIMTPMGYDAVKILAKIIKSVGTDKEEIRNALVKLQYTEGISLPIIDFDENRDLRMAQSEVKIIKNGKAEVVQ